MIGIESEIAVIMLLISCSSLPSSSSSSPGLRKVMVRAHRQAWCWQDEWYGLTIEDIRQLELETQLALARTMAQYSLSDTEEGAEVTNGTPATPGQDQEGVKALGEGGEVEGGRTGLGDALQTRGELTKQWSTSSKSSNRSSKRGGEWSDASLCSIITKSPSFKSTQSMRE